MRPALWVSRPKYPSVPRAPPAPETAKAANDCPLRSCGQFAGANSHVYPTVDQQDWGTTYAQRPQLFRNVDGTKFEEVSPATGSGLADLIRARGPAFGDLFNDGHIDVILNNIDSAPSLLRNVVNNNNHWIGLKLVGGPKSPRDAIGAKVFLTSGGGRQRADIFSGGSYGSRSDQRLHFRLGQG